MTGARVRPARRPRDSFRPSLGSPPPWKAGCVSSPPSRARELARGRAVTLFVYGSASPAGWGHRREGGYLFHFYSLLPQARDLARGPPSAVGERGLAGSALSAPETLAPKGPFPGADGGQSEGRGRHAEQLSGGNAGGNPAQRGFCFGSSSALLKIRCRVPAGREPRSTRQVSSGDDMKAARGAMAPGKPGKSSSCDAPPWL